MPNCKPGDLAVVVTPSHPELADNVGVFVTVIRPSDTTFARIDGLVWWVETVGPSKGFSSLSNKIFDIPTGAQVICPDACLRPIRPGKQADTTTTSKEKTDDSLCETRLDLQGH